eukprot:4736839-Prymnesium_polylepis.1
MDGINARGKERDERKDAATAENDLRQYSCTRTLVVKGAYAAKIPYQAAIVVERPSLALTLTPSVGHANRSTATVCCRDHRM